MNNENASDRKISFFKILREGGLCEGHGKEKSFGRQEPVETTTIDHYSRPLGTTSLHFWRDKLTYSHWSATILNPKANF